MREASKRIRLLSHWAKMFLGRSYYHTPQDLGKAFVPGEPRGFFNDLTHKVQWRGLVDEQGVPVNIVEDEKRVYFATTIVQKALGHWDMWLITGATEHKNQFLSLCNWLLQHQNDQGGWPLWPQLGLYLPSPYSAMTQGEAISALVRAWILTRDQNYLSATRQALVPLMRIVDEGGTRRVVQEGSILEEVPSFETSGILNGWVFSLFGLYDYLLVEENPQAKALLEDTLCALRDYLPRYNAGYWSFYDLTGTLASPFYHRLHIAQLQALELAFPEHAPVFRSTKEAFLSQLRNSFNRTRALLAKGYQKIRRPPEVVLK